MRGTTEWSLNQKCGLMLVGTTVACLAAACSPTPSAPIMSATSVSSATLAANGEGAANKPGRTSRRGAEPRTPNNGPVTFCSPPN